LTTQINGRELWPYVKAGLLMNIKNEEFLKKIRPSELAASTFEGGVYALPMDTQTWGIFYNKTLFSKAGISEPPKTVSALFSDVQKLKSAGIIPFAAGFATPWTIGQYFDYGASSVLTPAAQANFDNYVKGDFSYESVPGMANVMKVFDLIVNNTQPKPLDADISASYSTFASAQAAMLVQGNWSILQIRELNPNLDMGMFPVPFTDNANDVRFPTQYGFVINFFKSTKVMDGIRKYIDFYLNQNGPAGFYYDQIGIPSSNMTAKVKLDPASDLLEQYMSANKTVEAYHMLLPAGYEQEIFTLSSAYIANHRGDHAWMESQLDAQLKKFSNLQQTQTK